MVQTANTIFRDFVTDGVPASGANKPAKAAIRQWGTQLESLYSAAQAGGGLAYATKAAMDADLAHAANQIAWVLEDTTVANNGIYQKVGASGAGSWNRLGDLPYSYIKASNAGAGTVNAIVATTSIPIPAADGGALVALPIVADNTASPVTVSFNGGTALTIKTVTGENVPVGGLRGSSVIAGYVTSDGTEFRLFSERLSLPKPQGNKLLGWNAEGTALENKSADGTGDMISTNNLSDVADAGAALENLGGASKAYYVPKANLPVSVLDYLDGGQITGNSANDTPIIENAAAAAVAEGRQLYFPKAANAPAYAYGGDGIKGQYLNIKGDGQAKPVIAIDDGRYFIDDNQLWGSLRLDGIRFTGGAGAVRNRYTGNNVNHSVDIFGCEFLNYTVCAYSENCDDGPGRHIENNFFEAANSTSTIGVALSGLTDNDRIVGNRFNKNKVHIKLDRGGNNAYIFMNDFLRFDAGTGRHDIWIVPRDTYYTSGAGCWIGPNKSGNEFRATDGTDIPVIFADEGAGTYFGDRLPVIDAASTGYVSGINFDGLAVFFNGSAPNTPVVYSTTKNVYGCEIDLVLGGTPPTRLIEFREEPDIIANQARVNIIHRPKFAEYSLAAPYQFDLASSYNNVRRETLQTLQAQVNSHPANSTVRLGSGSPGPKAQWRFSKDVVIRSVEIFCLDQAVAAGGAVSAVVLDTNVGFTPTIKALMNAGDFSAKAYGAGRVNKQESLQVEISADANAGQNSYLVTIEYDEIG